MLPLRQDEDIEIADRQIANVQKQYEMTSWQMMLLYYAMKRTPEYREYRDNENNYLALNKFVLLLMHKHIHNAAMNIEPKKYFSISSVYIGLFDKKCSTVNDVTKPLVLGVKT